MKAHRFHTVCTRSANTSLRRAAFTCGKQTAESASFPFCTHKRPAHNVIFRQALATFNIPAAIITRHHTTSAISSFPTATLSASTPSILKLLPRFEQPFTMAKTATEFEKMIHSGAADALMQMQPSEHSGAIQPWLLTLTFSTHTDRSRKKNEALAAKIFGKTKAAGPAAGGKLAARAGINKVRP